MPTQVTLGVLLVLLLATSALAGPREDADAKRKEGDRLFAVGDLAGALSAYDEGKAILNDPIFDLGRGQTLLKLRRYDEAKTAYQAYLDSGKAGKHKREVQDAISQIESIVKTSLDCRSTPPGATVYLDSKVDDP